MDADVVVVGAGIAGLTAARALAARGARAIVLDRAAGVGGRCATRRVDGLPVDHGLPFLHGVEPAFLDAIAGVPDATPIAWPVAPHGPGPSCSPDAFAGGVTRVAFVEGLTRFPKALARGLDVRLGRRVDRIAPAGRGALEVVAESEPPLRAPAVVLAMPVPQAGHLIAPIESSAAFGRARAVLELPRWNAAAALIARYDGVPPPPWQVAFPAAPALADVIHDSSKRGRGAALTLVLHGRRAFSRAVLDAPASGWVRALLDDAAAALGGWIGAPARVDTHLWPYARTAAGTELAAPVTITLENGATLAWCGDGFDAAGGAEGAHRSGLAVARRLADVLGSPAAARHAG